MLPLVTGTVEYFYCTVWFRSSNHPAYEKKKNYKGKFNLEL